MNYLVAGLGNIGQEYASTRHNIGFTVLDVWAQASNAVFTSGRYGSTTEVSYKGCKFTLLKPSTYMNLSGKAVNYWLNKLKIPRERLIVVVDDLAIPFGTLRLRARGSAGGHNGLKSIDYSLASDDYARLRVGTGNGGFAEGHQVDFVLGQWLAEEVAALPEIVDRAINAIKCFGTEGVDRAMTQFNQKPSSSSPSTKKEV